MPVTDATISILAHLVYQARSLKYYHALSVIRCRWHHLCTPLLATGLDIEIFCGYAFTPLVYALHIFSDSNVQFLNGSHFGTFLCYPAHHHGDYILHMPMYLFFTYIHKRNNANVTYFLKFMSIFLKLLTSLRY